MSKKGFTVIEVLTAGAIFSLVVVAFGIAMAQAFRMSSTFQISNTNSYQNELQAALLDAQLAIRRVGRIAQICTKNTGPLSLQCTVNTTPTVSSLARFIIDTTQNIPCLVYQTSPATLPPTWTTMVVFQGVTNFDVCSSSDILANSCAITPAGANGLVKASSQGSNVFRYFISGTASTGQIYNYTSSFFARNASTSGPSVNYSW